MTAPSERWRRVDALCQAALELPRAERTKYLSQVCGDPELRREVESLLAHAAAAEHFLEAPVDAVAAQTLTDEGSSLSGTRLGVFAVGVLLGAGGMGEVYRARDTRLNRDVALKILPLTFALDPERLERFRHEAQALASLNHPNVGAIYGFEEASGVYALVLELVDGPTLADRLDQGPIPTPEALRIACQMAHALECAHEHGIVHNDFKPSNVKLRPDGAVKVLDFGLATVVRQTFSKHPNAAPVPPSRGPILGTPAYASPEQSKGEGDKRSDIWAFGAVLYEMLSGRRAFAATRDTDVATDVDWTVLPASTSEPVCRLLRRCLEHDVTRRLRDIGEARIVLEDLSALDPVAVAPGTVGSASFRRNLSRRSWLPTACAVLAAAGLVAALLPRQPPAPGVVRLSLTLPPEQALSTGDRRVTAISPDGTQIAYVAAPAGLYLRSLSAFDSRAITGVEGTGNLGEPVFSPDGQSILFHSSADQTLKRVLLSGGAAVTLCRAVFPYGVSWSAEGIVFIEAGRGILRVATEGGEPQVLIPLRPDQAVQSPQLLPGGDQLLYTVATGTGPNRWDSGRVVVRSLTSNDEVTVVEGGSDARYVATGHLVYAVAGNLLAVPFNLRRLQIRGPAVPVIQGIRRGDSAVTGAAQFGIATNGTLMYVPGAPSAKWDLGIIDRRGTVDHLPLPPGSYEAPRVSPDGRRIAFATDDGREAAIWIHELGGTTSPKRLTFGRNARYPVWSRDGRHVAYQADESGAQAIFWQSVDGGAPERLTAPDGGESHEPEAWSPATDVLVFSSKKASVITVWTLSLNRRDTHRFGDVRSSTRTGAVFSPDGRWLAYASSHDSGKTIYVEPFPGTGAKHQLSISGARQPNHPLWSPDGRELFYNPGPGLFEAVPVITAPSFGFGKPLALPRFFPGASTQSRRPFDILPDGRFVSPISSATSSPTVRAGQEIRVVLNWFTELTAIGK